MTELASANRNVLNDHARKLLAKLKLRPNPGALYVSQLMLHFLEDPRDLPKHGLANERQARYLRERLELIDATNPVELIDIMLLTGPESSFSKGAVLGLKNPRQVAQIMLQALHRVTAAQIDEYPPPL